jgi:hypothetical protein
MRVPAACAKSLASIETEKNEDGRVAVAHASLKLEHCRCSRRKTPAERARELVKPSKSVRDLG